MWYKIDSWQYSGYSAERWVKRIDGTPFEMVVDKKQDGKYESAILMRSGGVTQFWRTYGKPKTLKGAKRICKKAARKMGMAMINA